LPAGRHIRRFLREQGVKPNVESEFDNIDTIKTAIAATDQIAILPLPTAQREVDSGTLCVIELQPATARPLGIIHRRPRGAAGNGRDGQLSPAAKAFVDFLIEHVAEGDTAVASAASNAHQMVGGSS